MAKTESLGEALREVLIQLWRSTFGRRKAMEDELERIEREFGGEDTPGAFEADADSPRRPSGLVGRDAPTPPSPQRPSRTGRRSARSEARGAGDDIARPVRVGGAQVSGDSSGGRIVVNGIDVTDSVGHAGRGSPVRRGGAPVVVESEFEVEGDAVRSLDLESRNGAVTVEANGDDPGRMTGKAVVRCGGVDRAEAERRLEETVVRVRVARNGRAVVGVEFPPASSEEVASHDGASFMLGVAALDAVSISTSNGAVASRGFEGPCIVRTSNGEVEVTAHTGDIDVRTSNGAVEIEHFGDAGMVRVATSNAGVEVLSAGEEVGLDLKSSNGPMTVSLPSGWRGTVDAKTSNDTLTIDAPQGRYRTDGGRQVVAIGGGGSEARIKTSNGRVGVLFS